MWLMMPETKLRGGKRGTGSWLHNQVVLPTAKPQASFCLEQKLLLSSEALKKDFFFLQQDTENSFAFNI